MSQHEFTTVNQFPNVYHLVSKDICLQNLEKAGVLCIMIGYCRMRSENGKYSMRGDLIERLLPHIHLQIQYFTYKWNMLLWYKDDTN